MGGPKHVLIGHHATHAGSEEVDYDETVCKVYTLAANASTGTFYKDSRTIQFHNTQEIDRLVNRVLGAPDSDISEWIYAHTQTFQHVYRIRHHAGDMFKDKYTISRYTKFFDMRHALVHTLNQRSPATSDYFDIVRDLFDRVERENPQYSP